MAAINNSTTIRRAKFFDAVARWIITSGGILVIASVIAILVLIVSVTLPLFLGATSDKRVDTEIPEVLAKADVLCVGVDRVELEGSGEGDADAISGYLVADDGTFTFVEFPSADVSASHAGSSHSPGNATPGTTTTSGNTATNTGNSTSTGNSTANAGITVLGTQTAESPGGNQGATVVRVERSVGNQYTLLWSDGSVSLVKARLFPQYDEHGQRTVGHQLETLHSFPVEDGTKPTAAAIRATRDELVTCVRLLANNQLAILRQTPSGGGGLFGGSSGTKNASHGDSRGNSQQDHRDDTQQRRLLALCRYRRWKPGAVAVGRRGQTQVPRSGARVSRSAENHRFGHCLRRDGAGCRRRQGRRERLVRSASRRLAQVPFDSRTEAPRFGDCRPISFAAR